MAKPRIFISSTYYDLHYVRDDIERFIKELGYEPVRHESGAIPYGKDEPPDKYAYREVELCDIMVCIIGGRFGTESSEDSDSSITQVELKKALDNGIQVFIFIENGVFSEYSTFQLNKEKGDITYKFVDDIRIYKFIELIYQLPCNNPITAFQNSRDIINYLRQQWAGLFQRFLREQKRISEIKVLDEIKTIAGTLHGLVNFLTEERKDKDEAIKSILVSNHPAFTRFANIINVRYRVFFTTKSELDKWLKARRYSPISPEHYDSDSVYEWNGEDGYIKVTEPIFDEGGRLKSYSRETWSDDWINFIEQPHPGPDDDVPF